MVSAARRSVAPRRRTSLALGAGFEEPERLVYERVERLLAAVPTRSNVSKDGEIAAAAA